MEKHDVNSDNLFETLCKKNYVNEKSTLKKEKEDLSEVFKDVLIRI